MWKFQELTQEEKRLFLDAGSVAAGMAFRARMIETGKGSPTVMEAAEHAEKKLEKKIK
jgi:hypothetical protein